MRPERFDSLEEGDTFWFGNERDRCKYRKTEPDMAIQIIDSDLKVIPEEEAFAVGFMPNDMVTLAERAGE